MKRLIPLVLLLMVFATSAQGQACQALTIEDIDGSPTITERGGEVESVHTALVGTYLWVNTGELESEADLGVGSVSHEVGPLVSGATVCDDGSVTFHEDTVEPDPMPVPVVVDIEPTPTFSFDAEAWFEFMETAPAIWA